MKYNCELCDFKCTAEYRLRQHWKSKHVGHQSKRKKLKDDENLNLNKSTLSDERELNCALDHIVNMDMEESIYKVSISSIM